MIIHKLQLIIYIKLKNNFNFKIYLNKYQILKFQNLSLIKVIF